VLLACGLLAASAAHAQDPRASLAQKAARDWLALVDRLDADASWKAAAPRFRQAITVPQWTNGMRLEREPRGAIVTRTITATSFGNTFNGVPDSGQFALVKFRSSFAHRPEAEEHVSLELGADNTWRVIGYVIL